MWTVKEHCGIKENCRKLPNAIVKKYELWKSIVHRHGPEKLMDFHEFHDEKLRGERENKRTSRLGPQFWAVYSVERKTITVFVLEIIRY